MKSEAAIKHILKRLENELPSNLIYHAIDHTRYVMDVAKVIGQEEGIGEHDMALLLTAAAYHDVGFTKGYSGHEEVGCTIAEQELKQFEYSEEDILIIQNMILATKVPQVAHTHLEKILCDADLEYLGGEDYERISRGLFEELNLNGFSLDEDQWLDLQINFLQEHHYWTTFCLNKKQERKQRTLRALIELREKKNSD